MTHEQLQSQCYQWFWEEFKFTEWARMLYQNKNNSSNRISGARDKALGTVKGVSDMTFVGYKQCCFMEFKVNKDTQRPEQITFEEQVSTRGHEYHIVRSLEQFKLIIWRNIMK